MNKPVTIYTKRPRDDAECYDHHIKDDDDHYLDYDDFVPQGKSGGQSRTNASRQTKQARGNGANSIYSSRHVRLQQAQRVKK